MGHTECWSYENTRGGLYYVGVAMLVRMFFGMFIQLFHVSTFIITLQLSNPSSTLGQWRNQKFFFGGDSTNSVKDRGQNGDVGAVAP